MDDESKIMQDILRLHELKRAGKWEEADAASRELIEQSPHIAATWFERGLIQWRGGDRTGAISSWQKSVNLSPGEGLFWHALSAGLNALGQTTAAAQAGSNAIKLDVATAPYWQNLGDALTQLGRWVDASMAYQHSLRIDQNNAAAWAGLGAAEYQLDQAIQSEAAYAQAAARAPERLDIQVEYAHVLAKRGNHPQAVSVLRGVIMQHGGIPGAWVEWGHVHALQEDWKNAALGYEKALELAPGRREIASSLFQALLRQGVPSKAETLARGFIASDAKWAEAWAMLGVAQQAQGRTDESLASFKQALDIEPSAARHSRLLWARQYVAGETAETLYQAHREWNDHYGAVAVAPAQRRDNAADRKLKLGFVSANFGRHPTGYLGLPTIEYLDKNRCSVACYYDGVGEDDFTRRFRAASDQWRSTGNLGPDAVAALVRQDEIDVLIDLMGHAGRLLTVFAQKPAPLQVTWLGYVATTGLTAIDYLLADRFLVLDAEEQWYAEKILRLPSTYACYATPAIETPPVGPLPALAAGHVTFGCFNNPAKFSAPAFDAWCEILKRVPDSRLLVKYGGLGELFTTARLMQEFYRRGIDPSRVTFEGWSPRRELLNAYSRVDLALDTQPYGGGLTTIESLWMGVPVVTYPGAAFAGRRSVSYLNTAGLSSFVAADQAGYVDLAVSWAGRLEELSAIRAELQEKLRYSPLCDGPRFAKDFLEAVLQAWQSKLA